jgi:hypothetical protein
MRVLARLRRPAIASVVLAVAGTALFGTLHAWLIEPIWRRLPGGVPFALLASVGMTWCYSELVARGVLSGGIAGGALFGAAIWAALLPMTAFAAYLRVSGLRSRLGDLEIGADLLVVAATGVAVGFAVSRSWRVALAAGACLTGVALAMAGPIAVTVGATHRHLLIGFLPIYIAAGAGLSILMRGAEPRDRSAAPRPESASGLSGA